jgi:membrane associated rhomboid family serine protease
LTGLRQGGAWAGVLGYALVLSVVFALQTGYEGGIDWARAGAVEVDRVRAGQWWRVITALTLHADFPHLIGNLIFGGFFGLLLARQIGGGLSWLLILLAGAAGNMMNVAVQRPEHASLGASTAVFGALGLLAAYLWSGRHLLHDTWARRWAPMVGGLWLLAWLGTGDEQTDIVAHLTGFLAGCGLGAVLGAVLAPGQPGPLRQAALGTIAVLGVAGAWALGLAALG